MYILYIFVCIVIYVYLVKLGMHKPDSFGLIIDFITVRVLRFFKVIKFMCIISQRLFLNNYKSIP